MDSAWLSIMDDYELIKLLGSGSYSQVMHARHLQTKMDVAIKLLKNCFTDDYEAKKLLNEIQFMRQLSAIKENCFTTRLFDVIIPNDVNVETAEPLEYVFLVIEMEPRSMD